MPVIKEPNILITGTPGTGKSLLCEKLSRELNFQWIDISKLARDEEFIEGYDVEYECPILDEDQIIDHLEPIIAVGGNIIEYHGCEFFPKRFFNIVYVVWCGNTILYDRLSERNYSAKKLKSNVECEIFQSILEEAKESYDDDIVVELKNQVIDDIDTNINIVKDWYDGWKRRQI